MVKTTPEGIRGKSTSKLGLKDWYWGNVYQNLIRLAIPQLHLLFLHVYTINSF